jgi:hypothetical protein
MPGSTFEKRLAALLLSLLSAAAVADENPSILAVNRSVSLSYLRSSMYYLEPDSGQSTGSGGYFDYEQGTLTGGQVAFSYMGPKGLYLNAAWNQAKGTVDYHGVPPGTVEATSRATTHELDLKIGKGFASRDADWMFTPYLSGGKRYWKRDVAIDTPGEFAETYTFNYFGLGELIQYSPWTRWVFTGDGMIGKTVHASIDVPTSGLNHTALGTAPIIKLALDIDYQAAAMLHLFAGFEYIHFTFGQSDVQASGFIEPNSETTLRNLTIGLRLSF